MKERENFPHLDNEDREQKRSDLLREKFNACRGAVSERLGVTNVYKIAEYFYYSLYQPGEIDNLDINPDPNFPNKITNLKNPFFLEEGKIAIPEKEEFIREVRKAMTRRTDFESCLYEGAIEELSHLARLGNVIIWTKGDHAGIPELAPGSREQLIKASSAGIGRLRGQLSKETRRPRKEIITFAVSEDKLSDLPKILDSLKEKGVNKVIILEDTLKNLVTAVEIANQIGLSVVPVWVRQGREKNKLPQQPIKEMDEWVTEYNSIDRIQDLSSKLTSLGINEPTGKGDVNFIVDYDGVISNDKIKREIQEEAVINILKEKGWI